VLRRGLWPALRHVARLTRKTPGAQLQRLMAQREPHVAEAVHECWRSWQAYVQAGPRTPMMVTASALRWLPILLARYLSPDLRTAYHLGMVSGRAMVKLVRPVPSLDYAGRRLPELAGDMEQGVRDGVRILTDYAQTLGWGATTLANAIVHHLPLTPQGIEAVLNRQRDEQLTAGETQAYIDELTAARAQTIARTELSYAVNRGLRDVWALMITRGELSADTERLWVVEPDACDICEPYDGVAVPLTEEFDEGDPPLHPNCRCVVQLFQPEGG